MIRLRIDRRSAGRVREIARKEFRQIRRDPRFMRVLLVAPLLQLVLFGYAVSTDIRRTTAFVVDHDRTRASRELVQSFTASGYFHVAGRSDDSADIVRALDRGEAVLGIEIPPGYARRLGAGLEAPVQILLDGSDSNTATLVKQYAERIIARETAAGAAAPGVDLRARAWYNPALSSRNYNVPAVVGAIIFLVCLLLTSLAVVREREIGTLEQLMVSPLTPFEFIAGKTIPFAVIGLVDLVLVTAAALLWFHVPFEGSAPLLFLASVLYILSGLGLGLIISSISSTQQEAFLASFLVFMPTILLSGFMFPVSSMPEPFRTLTLANPMRHFLVIVRGVFLKGAGLGTLWPEFAALAFMGTALLATAATRFRPGGRT